MTAITVEISIRGGWLVTVERGNADNVQTMTLTDLERQQLAALLDSGQERTLHFEDVTA